MSRSEIPVEGMRCEGCERTLQAALTRVEGVRDAKADRQAKHVRVSFDAELVDEQRLRAQIEEAGYQPVAAQAS
jgi:copper chaperone CopZ